MPGVIPYKVSLDIDNQQALKKLLDVNTKMTQLENGQILIDFKYNKNIKDFNKKAAEISKLSPDLGVQFQYDVNKRGLLQAKEQLTQLTDLQVGVDTLGAKEYIKQLTKEVKDLFDDAASEQQLAAPIQKLLNTVITLDKDLLPSIQVELGDIYEEFEELSKLKPISLMNMGDIDDLEHDIKGFESALEKLKKQGAIDVADKADNKEIAELTERVSILEDRVLSLQHGLLSLSGEGFINASDSADVLLSKLVEIAKTLEIIPQKTYDVSKAVVHNGNISVIGKKERVRSDNMGRLPELLMNGMGHGSDFFFSTPPAADVASDTFGGLTNGFKGLKTYIIDLSKLKDELHQLQFEEQAAEDEAIEALKSINAFAFKESAGIDKLKELGIETKDTSRYGYEIPDTIEDLYNIVKDKIPDMSLTLKEFNNLLQEEIQKLNSMGEITQKGFYESQEKFGNEILPSDKLLEKLGYTGFTPISDGPNDGSGIGGWIINVEKYLHNTEDSIEYIKSFTEKQADEAEDYIANIDQHFAELNNQLKEKFKEYIVQVIQLAKTLGESIANGLADGIDAHSDSKKAIKSGEDFVNGVTHSIEDNTDKAVSAAKQLGEKVSDALDESLNNINDDTVSLSISSPTQVFDNEIQQNLVMLENYKNTIAEIDRLKLEPETDEIKHKIEELNKLADYFASKITTIQSENGHEVNRSMMQFSGNWNENLRSHYTEEQRKAFWKIAGERSGLNRHTVATEFSGITEELERIEEKSNKLASIYAKDITESRNYVSRLRADLLNLVETQEELAITSPKSKDYALYAKDIDVFSKRSPELLQFLDKLKTYEQASDFVKTDEWLDFLATLPKAHDYLESIGYDFEKISQKADENNLSSDIENEIEKAKIELEELRREYQALYEVVNSPNGPSKMTKEEVRRYFDLEEIIEEAEGKVKRLQSHLSDGKDNQNEFNLELKDGVEIQDTLGRVIDSNNAKILEGTKLISSQNGQLRVLYHGSNSSDFEKFDVNRIGENGSKFGRGAYFAFKKSDAQTYGHNVSEWFANITKIYNDNAQFSEEELTQIFNEYKNDIEGLWGSIDLDKFLNKMFGKTAYDQIDLLANDITGLSEDDLLKKLSYQGRYLQLEEGNGLVVFDLDNIVKARNVLSEIQKQSNETPVSAELTTLPSQIDEITQSENKLGNEVQEEIAQIQNLENELDELNKKRTDIINNPEYNALYTKFSTGEKLTEGIDYTTEEKLKYFSFFDQLDASGDRIREIQSELKNLRSDIIVSQLEDSLGITEIWYRRIHDVKEILQDTGGFFANSLKLAATYFNSADESEQLIAAKLNKSNFLTLDAKGKRWNDLFDITIPLEDQLRAKGIDPLSFQSEKGNVWRGNTKYISQLAQALGYLGVEIQNVIDVGAFGEDRNLIGNIVQVFDESTVENVKNVTKAYRGLSDVIEDVQEVTRVKFNLPEWNFGEKPDFRGHTEDEIRVYKALFEDELDEVDEFGKKIKGLANKAIMLDPFERRGDFTKHITDLFNNLRIGKLTPDEFLSQYRNAIDSLEKAISQASNKTPDLFEGKSGQLSFIENLTEAEEKASTAAEELVDDLSRVKDQIDGQMSFDDLQINDQIDYSVQSEEKLLPMVIESTDAIEKRNEEMRRMQAIQQAFMNDIGQSNEAKINRDITATLEQRRKEQEKLNEAKQEEVSTSLSSPTAEVDIKAEESAKAVEKEAEAMTEVKEESEMASTSKKGFAKANAEVLQSIKESLSGLTDEAELFKALNNIINKFSGKGSDERISTLANNIIKIKDALSGSIDDNSFIDALQKLSEQGENLKNLASVLKASKKQIESVKDSIDDSNELSLEDRDALAHQIAQSQEYEREQKRRLEQEKEIERARKEGQKQAEAYAKQQLDEQNKLTSSIENYSKKLQDAITADEIAKQTGAGVSKDLVNRWEALKADLSNIDVTADTSKAQEEFEKLKEKIDVALSPKERKFEKVIPEEIITNLGAQIEDFGAKNTRLSKELSERLEEVRRRYQALLNSGSTGDALERELKSISSELNKIKTEANAAGQAGKNFGHMMLDSLKSANARFIANYLSIQDMIRYVRELANTVREVDSAITELRKVSDASATRLQQNFEQSAKTAKELGSSITDVINQTADWARLGYNVDEAEKLARVTTLFQTVGDNMTAETASEAMISTLKAYSISVDESERIVDQYNEIANNFAIDTAGLADSITRAGAALHAGGNALSESMGLVVAANDSLQDPASVGQMLKTKHCLYAQ